ncbi:MAG: porin family protein [Crocinitomicaceae bacterium]|nr:porin family protein [Crocinitomicaceae bacterium]MCF8434499.1 porin family protein [Crocinitomicaceae bacterium]
MKKIFTIIGISFLSVSSLQAQTPVEQGNFIIDVYAGIPNWANSILYNNVEPDATQTDVRNYKLNGGLLSYGGRFEYMIADNFGVGVDVNYEVSGFNYDYTTQEYNDVTMQFENRDYNIDYKSKKLRAMARLNYHFVQNDRLDAYAGFAGGYKNVNRSIATDDTNYDDGSINGALIPVSFRIAVGTRIYFTNNIGGMIELGAGGGALLQFGLSAKF